MIDLSFESWLQTSTDLGIMVRIADRLSRETVDALWEQGVNMDDWDYVVFASPEVLNAGSELEDPGDRRYYSPKEYTFERILTGCCDNTWYLVRLGGHQVAVGVAYHS